MSDWTPVDMLDAIGANAARVPKGTKRVAIYLTGSGGIQWTNADVATLVRDDPELSLVYRIDQANDPRLTYLTLKTLVIDIEPGAASLGTAVQIGKVRQQHNLRTTYYYFKAEEPAVRAAVDGAGLASHADYWLADWTNDRNWAIGLLGTNGYVAVQYRSAATVDYSVVMSTWGAAPKPTPEPPKVATFAGSVTEHGHWDVHGTKGELVVPKGESWRVELIADDKGGWEPKPLPALKAGKKANSRNLKLAPLQIHPKVAAVGTTAAALTAVRGALAAFGVHVPLTDTEQAAIISALPVIAGYLKSSGVTL